MPAPTVAVTGATGTVGRHVLRELVHAGPDLEVRGLGRADPGWRLPGDAAWTRFSFTDPTTWTAAFSGVDAVFVVRPPELVDVTRDLLPALIAARDLGVRRAVLLSVLGAERNPLLPHRRIERWLETSGMAATTLRASNFMQNLAGVHAADIRDHDRIVVPAGDAAMSYVDARDVAAVAARCLVEQAPRRGAWDVTGPAAITHDDVAEALTRALGRPIRYTRPGLPRYWAHALRSGMPAGLVAATSVLYTLARVGVGSRTTTDVATVLGRSGADIATFADDYRAVWRPHPQARS
ncbi:NAD(P)H-binding protein [Actinomycetospora aeridis]|uniref:NAD(P)H-binding protein n=1 Tax=Actinomycetospora aeridis TaxID=3129231 RepID=A0ABU8NDU9_9PSEU